MKKTIIETNIMKSSEYHQFYLGILLQNQDFILDVYNKQIGLMYNKITKELSVPFSNTYNWLADTSLMVEGFIIGKSFDVVSWDLPEELPELIKDKLNDDFYIKYTGDLFYILNKPEYGKIHNWGEIYIIGFENERFVCVGKTKKSFFEEYLMTENEMVESARKRQGLEIYDDYTFSFEIDFYKRKKDISYKLDIEKIRSKLYDFLYPLKREKYILGVEVYEQIINDWRSSGVIPQQLFYIRDNMLLMKERLKYLCSLNLIPDRIYRNYCGLDINIHKICMDFESHMEINQIVPEFKAMTQKEVAILTDFLNAISKVVV